MAKADSAENDERDDEVVVPRRRGKLPMRARIARIVVFGVLPALMMTLAFGAAAFTWQAGQRTSDEVVATETVRAASDGAVAILSYHPDTVERELDAGRTRLTGDFLSAYSKLTHDVVIPGAQQKRITASARVPGGGERVNRLRRRAGLPRPDGHPGIGSSDRFRGQCARHPRQAWTAVAHQRLPADLRK